MSDGVKREKGKARTKAKNSHGAKVSREELTHQVWHSVEDVMDPVRRDTERMSAT